MIDAYRSVVAMLRIKPASKERKNSTAQQQLLRGGEIGAAGIARSYLLRSTVVAERKSISDLFIAPV